MKIRLILGKDIKAAYENRTMDSNIDLKDGINAESIQRVPEELFRILGKTLSFIENINHMEGSEDEDK
ncbi:MAG: hypothetical protein GX329_00330 [Tissierellia bacterium]|nr:hypothetical protein [Tissierellia bacterium]